MLSWTFSVVFPILLSFVVKPIQYRVYWISNSSSYPIVYFSVGFWINVVLFVQFGKRRLCESDYPIFFFGSDGIAASLSLSSFT